MTEYISARDAILRELESAEAALRGAEAELARTEQKFQDAQKAVTYMYEARAMNSRNVDRLRRALDAIEGVE